MLTPEQRRPLIEAIRRLPAQLEALVAPLSPDDLITPFLAGEWSVAQNVHHLADSHMNSFIRLKLILSEQHPTLKPYDQDAWAAMPDSNHADIEDSLLLLRGLHRRWTALFDSLDEAAWARTGFHPANGDQSAEDLLRSYAAHGEGHLDQINRTLAARR